MRRLRLTIEFDGTEFSGWQRQAAGERTVQAVLEKAFDQLPGKRSSISGAGRTDAGVHALGMVGHIDVQSTIPDKKLSQALNAYLPNDVVVLKVETVDDQFEAQFGCKYRRYLYRFWVCREERFGLALNRARVFPVFSQLDEGAMSRAAKVFEGSRDFSALATQETRSRIRTVHMCTLERSHAEYRLHIAGDGFLRNMVRAIVGTLILVGSGKISVEQVDNILESKDRSQAGKNVSPRGLYFVEAGYTTWDQSISDLLAFERIANVLG